MRNSQTTLAGKSWRCTFARLVCPVALVFLGLTAGEPLLRGQDDAAPVRVGGDIKPPVKTKDVKPIYPAVARQARTQGVVILEITVGTDGKVKSAKVLKSMPALDIAAMNAVKQWEFRPTMVDGKATPVIMTVALTFKLE